LEETTASSIDRLDGIESALAHIPADDRVIWISVGNALKTDIGDDGYILWERWSRGSEKFDSHRIMADWRSLKIGMCHLGTIFHLARKHGWTGQTGVLRPRPQAAAASPTPTETPKGVVEDMRKVIGAATPMAGHPYLAGKGFPNHFALVHEDRILVPMWRRRQLSSVQTITAEGEKRFWPRSITRGASYRIGRSREAWIVEGLATAMSLQACLDVLSRRACIIVAFSAANVRNVAQSRTGARIIADNDKSGTGARYAEQTGRPWTMPATEGFDLNDVHQREGLYAAIDVVRELI